MQSNCKKYERTVLIASDPLTGTIYLFQPRCKMWNCSTCANENRLLWQAKIGHGYDWYIRRDITDWHFVTITSHRKLKNQAQCLFVWPKSWKKLSARMRRKFPGVKYVLLPEHHKNGRVHWHMIVSGGVDTKWLKKNAPPCGLGYMTEGESVTDSSQAIMYVSKYVAKSLEVETWPKGLRRVATSQKWPLLPPNDDYEKLELTWKWLTTYPTEGLSYLAEGLSDNTGCVVKVISK